MIQIKRADVSITVEESIVIVHTQNQTITFHLTSEELVALTAELYGLDPAPLMNGATPVTPPWMGCRCG